jgi:hypothetical protein
MKTARRLVEKIFYETLEAYVDIISIEAVIYHPTYAR